MKQMTYDPKANAAYAYGMPNKVQRTVEVNPNIHLDLSTDGHVVGIEILNAKTVLSKTLGMRLNADDMQKIEYEIEEKAGIYLHMRIGANKASLVLPGRLAPA